MSENFASFKAFDIRGKVPEELSEELVYKIGLAYANEYGAKSVVTGRDTRDSSVVLQAALNEGLTDGGVNVTDLGLCGTENVYFGAGQDGQDGGLMITASHNPIGYNGVKPVLQGGAPLAGESGLPAIKKRIAEGRLQKVTDKGGIRQYSYIEEYLDHLLKLVPPSDMPKMKVVANPGNGCAGPTAQLIFDKLDLDVVWVHKDPDPTFPNGIPNPLLEENRASTSEAVKSSGAELGIAWDGDFDRCFFFDNEGNFVEGYYVVGLMAEAVLSVSPGAGIVYDPRLYWNTQEIIEKSGGRGIMSKTGHAFIKETMRKEDALYGGEMSAHHYFREFSYCDSGMLPWMMLLRVLKNRGMGLGELLNERMKLFPCPGEINFKVSDTEKVMKAMDEEYTPKADKVARVDGLSLEFNNEWRFNVRASNTEPLMRLNVESRGDEALMREKTDELVAKIKSLA